MEGEMNESIPLVSVKKKGESCSSFLFSFFLFSFFFVHSLPQEPHHRPHQQPTPHCTFQEQRQNKSRKPRKALPTSKQATKETKTNSNLGSLSPQKYITPITTTDISSSPSPFIHLTPTFLCLIINKDIQHGIRTQFRIP
jgi:hypothetical protein